MTLSAEDRLDILDLIGRADRLATRRDAGAEPDETVVSSILLIVDPATPITIRTAAAITQTVRRTAGTWRIARRTVAPAAGGAGAVAGAAGAGTAGGAGATGGAGGEAGPRGPG